MTWPPMRGNDIARYEDRFQRKNQSTRNERIYKNRDEVIQHRLLPIAITSCEARWSAIQTSTIGYILSSSTPPPHHSISELPRDCRRPNPLSDLEADVPPKRVVRATPYRLRQTCLHQKTRGLEPPQTAFPIEVLRDLHIHDGVIVGISPLGDLDVARRTDEKGGILEGHV